MMSEVRNVLSVLKRKYYDHVHRPVFYNSLKIKYRVFEMNLQGAKYAESELNGIDEIRPKTFCTKTERQHCSG